MHCSRRRQLKRSIVIGDIHRSAKHQVFEQMREACMLRMLVARTHIIDDIQRNHLRTGIFVMHQPQTIVQRMPVDLEHSPFPALYLFQYFHFDNLHILFGTVVAIGLHFLDLSTTSMPSSTSPNTVYSPSR